MTVIEKLRSALNNLSMATFFSDIKKELGSYGVIILDPHKAERKAFTSIIGIMGDNSYDENYTLNIIRKAEFITLGTAKINIYPRNGLSIAFYPMPSSLFSYITYPILQDNQINFLEGTIPDIDIDLLLELIHNIKEIRGRIDRMLKINLKVYKKTYISKCKTLLNNNNKGNHSYKQGWQDALKTLLTFMTNL